MRSLRTAMKSSPRSPQLEKARAQQRRPNAEKKKNKKTCKLHYLSLLYFTLQLLFLYFSYLFLTYYVSMNTVWKRV